MRIGRDNEPMNLVVFDVDGTLIQSTDVDDECFARAIEVAWGIPNISTQWGDYEHVTDSGIAAELFQKHFDRVPEPAEMESLQQEFANLLTKALSDTGIPQTLGVAALLQRLQHHESWRAAIATGSWAYPIGLKLRAAGLSLSTLPMATSEDAFDRAEVIQVAANRAKEVYDQQEWNSVAAEGTGRLGNRRCHCHQSVRRSVLGRLARVRRLGDSLARGSFSVGACGCSRWSQQCRGNGYNKPRAEFAKKGMSMNIGIIGSANHIETINRNTDMDERHSNSPDKPNLASFEGDLFGELFGFKAKVMDLVRNSGLDDEKLELVSERIEQLLADATSEMKRTKNLNLAEPLESAYEKVKSMVDELTEAHHRGGT